jgi:hypothetical protein
MPSLNTGNAILSNAIAVNSSYNVGIGGAASGSFKLQVTGNGIFNNSSAMALQVNGGTFTQATASSYSLGIGNTGGFDLTLGTSSTAGVIQTWSSKTLSLNPQGNNVGIGTSTINGGSKLQVDSANGTAYSSNAQLRVSSGGVNNNRAQILFSDNALSDGKISYYPASAEADRLFSISARSTESDFVIKGNGNVGIGTSSPNDKLVVSGNNNIWTGVFSGTTTTSQSFGVQIFAGTNSSDTAFRILNGATTSTYMLVRGDGNVGIGSANPTRKLFVVGSVAAVNSDANDIQLNMSVDASTCNLAATYGSTGSYVPLTFSTNSDERMRITTGGNIGIGTNSPILVDLTGTSKPLLQIRQASNAGGQLRVGGSDGTVGLVFDYSNSGFTSSIIRSLYGSSSGEAAMYLDSGFIAFRTGTSFTERMRINSNGNIRLYITPSVDTTIEWYQTPANIIQGKIWTDGNPRVNVQCGGSNGVYLASGATSWTGNSDERLKNINSNIEGAVDKINTLRAVNFSWKDDSTNKENLGIIAQDIQKVFPQIIDQDKEGILGVRYTELIPVLIAAIQELNQKVNEQQQTINSLINR